MNDDERDQFAPVLNAYYALAGKLTDMKGRAGRARKAAKLRFEEQGENVPSWGVMVKALKDLNKALPVALKATAAIQKISITDTSFDDVKAKFRKHLPNIKPVSKAYYDITLARKEIYKEIGMKELGADVDLKQTAGTFTKQFLKFYKTMVEEFKKL